MELEVILPDEDAGMAPGILPDLAVHAEALGYRGVWLPDHLLPPEPFGPVYGGVYEPLVTLAFLAARTRRLRLGTSVLVLPLRNPFAVAKQAATLHALSGGRVALGVGVGWDRTEFESVGAEFSTRGARTDEALVLMRELFSGATRFDGRFHSFERGHFTPVPTTPLPIVVGGVSPAALRRAASLADEWQGVGLTPEAFADAVRRLRELTDRDVRVSTRIAFPGGRAALRRVLSELRAFADAGADTVAVSVSPYEGAAERLSELADAWKSPTP
jgi:probable F420-dependent oxidoreductase